MKSPALVSIHGGHSGQFCDHAKDDLEAIIKRYIELGYSWIGVTEHTPAITRELLDPGQRRLGLTPSHLAEVFTNYIGEGRRLQEKYHDQLKIYVAMEIETYSGYLQFVPDLIARHRPDYLVGSVHFVDDLPIDYSRKCYQQAVRRLGSLEALYCRYFDQQAEMIVALKPSVVGHFDLIRIFDDNYRKRLELKAVWERIMRNLELIREQGCIMDLNLRALAKGADEPYISRPILQEARDLGIAVVPGDDSHGVDSVGNHMALGIDLLTELGFSTNWQKPRLLPESPLNATSG